MALPTYNSKQVTIAWGGVPFVGLAQDSFVTFSRNVDRAEFEIGGDGKAAGSKLPDRSGTCTISFQPTSPSVAVLSGVLAYEDLNEELIGRTLLVSDLSGSVLAKMSGAYITSTGEIDLGSSNNGKTRSFTFFIEDLDWISVPTGLPSTEIDPTISSSITTIVSAVV
jgi:hypothetical protein